MKEKEIEYKTNKNKDQEFIPQYGLNHQSTNSQTLHFINLTINIGNSELKKDGQQF